MTLPRAKIFLLSLLGILDEPMYFEDASDVCLGCHYVYQDPASSKWICTCGAFYHGTECSHILLAKHLTGNPADDIFLLSGRHDAELLTGRPRKNIGQGFIRMPTKLHQNETSEGTTLQGLEIAKVIDGWRRQVCKNS